MYVAKSLSSEYIIRYPLSFSESEPVLLCKHLVISQIFDVSLQFSARNIVDIDVVDNALLFCICIGDKCLKTQKCLTMVYSMSTKIKLK